MAYKPTQYIAHFDIMFSNGERKMGRVSIDAIDDTRRGIWIDRFGNKAGGVNTAVYWVPPGRVTVVERVAQELPDRGVMGEPDGGGVQ